MGQGEDNLNNKREASWLLSGNRSLRGHPAVSHQQCESESATCGKFLLKGKAIGSRQCEKVSIVVCVDVFSCSRFSITWPWTSSPAYEVRPPQQRALDLGAVGYSFFQCRER